MQYRVYIRRDYEELEVYGELWDDGAAEWDTWGDTGTTFEVIHNPEFNICEMYDEDGEVVPLDTLTPQEIYNIIEMFTQDYWDTYIEED